MPLMNCQVLLTSRPAGIPQAENFALAEAPVPELADGQFLVRNHYLGRRAGHARLGVGGGQLRRAGAA